MLAYFLVGTTCAILLSAYIAILILNIIWVEQDDNRCGKRR